MKRLFILFIIGFFVTGTIHASSFEADTFKTKEGGELVITFIKHGSLMLTFNGKVIQVDPVSMYADYAVFPKADIVLITHEHGDHLDKEAIRKVEKEGTILITNQSSYDILGKGDVMGNGDVYGPVDYMTLEAVPAYNYTEGRQQFHPKGRDNGFVLTLGGSKIYIAGDTEDIPELTEIMEMEIDIAFLPVNQPYTMTVDQAVNAVNLFSPKVVYPYHYGDTPIEQLADRLKNSRTEVRIRDMR